MKMNLAKLVPIEKKLRLDKFIAIKYNLSRNQARLLIKQGNVKLNNVKITDCSKQVSATEVIEVLTSMKTKEISQVKAKVTRIPLQKTDNILYTKATPKKKQIIIHYEHADFLIINKGWNILSHYAPTKKESCDVSSTLKAAGYLIAGGRKYRQGIVHRLDENTTGLMIVTKTKEAYTIFQSLFQNQKINKVYVALVHNQVKKNLFEVHSSLANSYVNNKIIVSSIGKKAITRFYKITDINCASKIYTLIAAQLVTGRTHQIRVHLSELNHPVFGDAKYGKVKFQNNIALHSSLLSFSYKNEVYQFISIPDFQEQYATLNIHNKNFSQPAVMNFMINLKNKINYQ